MADEPVSGEPVSGANSLLTGKRTGNFSILGHFVARWSKKLFTIQEVTNEFPTQRNRERIRRIWEMFSREQGIIIAEHGTARNAADPAGATAPEKCRLSIYLEFWYCYVRDLKDAS